MTIPFRLELLGLELPDSIRNIIHRQFNILQERYPRIVNCHVLVRAPNGHHHKGEPYLVTITISLPGELKVEVSSASGQQDPRQADLSFAVDDAFRRVHRRLDQEEGRREARQKNRRSKPDKSTLI